LDSEAVGARWKCFKPEDLPWKAPGDFSMAVAGLFGEEAPVDLITFRKPEEGAKIRNAGGDAYLMEISPGGCLPRMLSQHCAIIKEKSLRAA